MSDRASDVSAPVAFVTAAAGAGIGGAITRRLAAAGYSVVVTDAHATRPQALAAELADEHGRPFLGITLDVTDHAAVGDAVDQAWSQFGRLDGIVNNAGWSSIAPIHEMTLETWNRCLAVDLTGTFSCLHFGLPRLIDSGGGAVVNISSGAAWETSTAHGAAYSAAKAGVLALTRVAAAEYGSHGIRVNAIAPGLIYNEFLRRIYPDDFFTRYADEKTLVGRVGQPDDIAHLAEFLLSPDKAGYITGEVYAVGGGWQPLT